MLQYRKIEHDLLLLREQLLLFEVGKKNGATPAHDDSEDWDYASADTKTETHGIHPYPAMMIPQVTRRLIRMYGTEGQTLLDPFCGSGTVLVEATLAGLNSYGIDINPLALLLSKVKTTPLDIEELKKATLRLAERYWDALVSSKSRKDDEIVPRFFNIEYWFHPRVSRKLALLKTCIDQIRDGAYRDFFLVAFSFTVRQCSYTRSGEFKLFRIPDRDLQHHKPNVEKVFFDRVLTNLGMMADYVSKVRRKTFTRILDEDSRRQTGIPPRTIDLVVTSPPYGDSRTTVAYGQFSRLSLQWLGFPWDRVRAIDSHSLGGKRRSVDGTTCSLLKRTVGTIAKQDFRRAEDVMSFFNDFHSCLYEMNRVCKTGATLCFVVGNRTVKGVTIPTDRILTEMASEIGFEHVSTLGRNIPNKRMPLRNSPSNIQGQTASTMTREHIVIVKKVKETCRD